MLGKKGRKVLVLERNDRIGGCLRTEEITAPGFVHDVMATTLVLFLPSPAYAAIGKDLEARGFAVADSDLPTGVIRPDGSYVLFSMDRARNVAPSRPARKATARPSRAKWTAWAQTRPSCSLCSAAQLWSSADGDGDRARGLEARPARAGRLVRRALCVLRGGYLESTYRSDAIRALWAPWVPPLRPQPGKRVFRADGQVDRLRRRSSPAARSLSAARRARRRLRALIVDQGGRCAAAPMSSASRRTRPEAPGPFGSPAANKSMPPRASLLDDAEQLYGRPAKDHPARLPAGSRESGSSTIATARATCRSIMP